MKFSTQTDIACSWFGTEDGIKLLLDAGYPCLDLSLFAYDYVMADDWKSTAKKLRKIVEDRGASFNQAHAPFGGGFEFYTQNTVPNLPRVFDFVAELGVKKIVVHPLQKGRYYGNQKELFEQNVLFYQSLGPAAKNAGIRIGVENMWQYHPAIPLRIVDDSLAPPEELSAMVDTLNDPETFTVCLDIGHTAVCGREPQDCIRTIGGKRLGCLHVHDVDYVHDSHTLPGVMKINWDDVCKALADVDYQGDFTLEADNFLLGFGKEFAPQTARFMAERAKFLAEKVEAFKMSTTEILPK